MMIIFSRSVVMITGDRIYKQCPLWLALHSSPPVPHGNAFVPGRTTSSEVNEGCGSCLQKTESTRTGLSKK